MSSGNKIQLSFTQTISLVKEYLSGASARKLSLKYGCKCHKSINKILRDNNIKVRTKKQSAEDRIIIFSQKEIDQLLLMNNNPLITLKDIASFFNKANKTIKKQFKYNNIIYNENKYDDYLIDKFNVINTEEKAYWLGFLAADGSVSKKQLILQLAKKDLPHLIKFKKFIGVDYKISKIITTLPNNKKYTGYRYTISSMNFVKTLRKHGLYQNKSLTLIFPKTVPKHLINHYIRGLIDGDGSFYISNKLLNFSFVSSYKTCDKVRDIFIKKCNISKRKLTEYIAKNGGKYYYLAYSTVQSCKIADYLYQDATIYLKRKKDIVDNFKITHKFKTYIPPKLKV